MNTFVIRHRYYERGLSDDGSRKKKRLRTVVLEHRIPTWPAERGAELVHIESIQPQYGLAQQLCRLGSQYLLSIHDRYATHTDHWNGSSKAGPHYTGLDVIGWAERAVKSQLFIGRTLYKRVPVPPPLQGRLDLRAADLAQSLEQLSTGIVLDLDAGPALCAPGQVLILGWSTLHADEEPKAPEQYRVWRASGVPMPDALALWKAKNGEPPTGSPDVPPVDEDAFSL